MTAMAGGCACRRVRYLAEVPKTDAYLCHCRMCQRATGSVSIAFVNVPAAGVRWEREPDWYRWSAIAERPFCATCGTSLGFRYLADGSDQLDLTVASFDDPSVFRPAQPHFGAESLLQPWLDTTKLPRVRSDEYAPLQQRWAAAG